MYTLHSDAVPFRFVSARLRNTGPALVLAVLWRLPSQRALKP